MSAGRETTNAGRPGAPPARGRPCDLV